MESVIYKYALDFDGNGDAEIIIPNNSSLLKVGVQQKIRLLCGINYCMFCPVMPVSILKNSKLK
jgi:hypothetical protein